MDLNMPVMGGLIATQNIRSYQLSNNISDILIVAYTAYNDP